MRFAVLLAFVIFGAVACASMQSYPIGIPATGGEKFFFHMEREAADRGYSTYRSTNNDSLSVTVNGGSLRYSVSGDEIYLYTSLAQSDLPPTEERRRHANLKSLSDDLVASARERAEDANVFE